MRIEVVGLVCSNWKLGASVGQVGTRIFDLDLENLWQRQLESAVREEYKAFPYDGASTVL
jgi:hypothetical protein